MTLFVKKFSGIFILAFFLISTNCQKEISGRTLNHVVLVWLKDSNDMELISRIMTESIKLGEIKEVKNVHVGRPVKSERNIVDSSFDLGINMIFESPETMQKYLKDPRHIEFFKKFIEGNTKKILVYDF